jgi:uncharacterized protein YjiS (DUF1127 family)
MTAAERVFRRSPIIIFFNNNSPDFIAIHRHLGAEITLMEGYMSIAIINRARLQSISLHVVEWRRRIRSRNELMMLSDRNLADLPFGRAEAKLEVCKWFWQP